jgi:tetratricopeptide (TPR) repeat protein
MPFVRLINRSPCSRPCPAGSSRPRRRDGAGPVVGLAGPYLAARLAVRDGDHREAAEYFERALRADPGNPLLISNAVFANAALGRWDMARRIAEDLPEDATGQELAGLVTFVDTVRSGDLSARGRRSRRAAAAGRSSMSFRWAGSNSAPATWIAPWLFSKT